MNAQIDTTGLTIAVRQRKGDYVQGPDADTGIWIFGRIIDKTAGTLMVSDKDGNEFSLMKNRAYKATREEFENSKEGFMEEDIEATMEAAMEAIVEEELEAAKEAALGEDNGVRIRPDWSKYTRHNDVKTASGKATIDIDDLVAGALRGLNPDDLYDTVARYIQKINETAVDAKGLEALDTVEKLRAKYGHLNPGMQRMNLGNRLRGALARAGMEHLPQIPWVQE